MSDYENKETETVLRHLRWVVRGVDWFGRRRCAFSRSNGLGSAAGHFEAHRGADLPARDFDATRFGAVGDGQTDCTAAFAKAIAACHEAGGGRVVVPAGTYLSGTIHLKSKVNLHVDEGATIRFSTDPAKYLPVVFTRFEGTEVMNYSPLLYAFEQEDIAVTGRGTLDGQGSRDNWWGWTSKARADISALVKMGGEDVPVAKRVFGEGHYLRPYLFQPCRCSNVLLEGVTVKNSPMWTISPLYCRNVTVPQVTVEASGPNTDGCDPDSCVDVLIEKCVFNTGDDCIAIKSGRDRDGHRVGLPSENIVIRGCTMKNGHGGITCGSEAAGDIRNVFAEDCLLNSPNLNMPLRFKTSPAQGRRHRERLDSQVRHPARKQGWNRHDPQLRLESRWVPAAPLCAGVAQRRNRGLLLRERAHSPLR